MEKSAKVAKNKGMSYIELIVVLTIFSVLSGVVIFDYDKFQAKVDIKNLASDIALKIVEAQKSSISGKLPPPTYSIGTGWKPSYGTYFNINPVGGDNKSFIYFIDLDNTVPPQNSLFDGTACTVECLEKISITKGNSISGLHVVYQGNPTPQSVNDLTATFSRINSGLVFASNNALLPSNVSYIQITITSPQSTSATIKLYPSGRVQIK